MRERESDKRSDSFIRVAFVTVNLTCLLSLVFSCLAFYRVAKEHRKQRNDGTTMRSNALLLFTCAASTMIPSLHMMVIWGVWLDLPWLPIVSVSIVVPLALAALACLFIAELRKLVSIFEGTPHEIPDHIVTMLRITMIISGVLVISWTVLNDTMHSDMSSIIEMLLSILGVTAGISVLCLYLSITGLFSNRLVRLVVDYEAAKHTLCLNNPDPHDHDSHHHSHHPKNTTSKENAHLSGCSSPLSSTNVSPMTSNSLAMDDDDYHDKKQPRLSPVISSSKSIHDLSSNQRPFVEATAKQLILSWLVSLGGISVISSLVCWSFSSGLQKMALAGYVCEQWGWGLFTLRVYLGEKSYSRHYDLLCGVFHRLSLRGALLLINARMPQPHDHNAQPLS